MRKIVLVLLTCVMVYIAVLWPAAAQDRYPSTTIQLVVGSPPSGTSDDMARLLAQRLTLQMNTTVVVVNKPGANANLAAEFVAKSKPDGYTLLVDTNQVILNRAFDEKINYDIFKDLTPVAFIAFSPFVLGIHPSIPANNVADFIAYVKANPGKLNYGSGGVGAMSHLGPLFFLQSNGLNAVHVPYKGAPPAVLDLVAGRIQFAMQTPSNMVPMMKEKRVKLLAITSLSRSPQLPDLPTLSESGMPGFELATWYGVMVPAKTPETIVKRLNDEIQRAKQTSEAVTLFEQQGLGTHAFTADEYGAYQRTQFDRWSKLIKVNNIKLDQ